MEDEAFVEAVRRFECLWKVTSRVYRDLRAKENAWKAVADEVGEDSVEVCQKRWKSLRDKFVRETKKKKTKTGQKGPIVVSSWPLFQTMSFLMDTVRHRTTTTNFTAPSSNNLATPSSESQDELLEPVDPLGSVDFDESFSLDFSEDTPTSVNARSNTPSTVASRSMSPSPQPQPPAKRRRKTLQPMDDVEKEILSSIKKMSSEPAVDKDTHFGNHVASTLRELPEREKALAKIEIDKILFNFKFPEQYNYPPPSQSLLSPHNPHPSSYNRDF